MVYLFYNALAINKQKGLKMYHADPYAEDFGTLAANVAGGKTFKNVINTAKNYADYLTPIYLCFVKRPRKNATEFNKCLQHNNSAVLTLDPTNKDFNVRFCDKILVFLISDNDKDSAGVKSSTEAIQKDNPDATVHFFVRKDEDILEKIREIFPFGETGTGVSKTNEQEVNAILACVAKRVADKLKNVPVQVPQEQWTIEQLRAEAQRLAAQRAM